MGSTNGTVPRAPVLALCHGAGPLPLLDDPMNAGFAESMRTRAREALNVDATTPPRAVVVVTAHWQTEPELRVSSAAKHGMIYDYYGFPEEAYSITHDAKGDPEIAGWVVEALREAGLKAVEDPKRGAIAHSHLPECQAAPNPRVRFEP